MAPSRTPASRRARAPSTSTRADARRRGGAATAGTPPRPRGWGGPPPGGGARRRGAGGGPPGGSRRPAGGEGVPGRGGGGGGEALEKHGPGVAGREVVRRRPATGFAGYCARSTAERSRPTPTAPQAGSVSPARTRPVWYAITTSWARSRTSSLDIARLTCVLTVRGDRYSRPAMSVLLNPS